MKMPANLAEDASFAAEAAGASGAAPARRRRAAGHRPRLLPVAIVALLGLLGFVALSHLLRDVHLSDVRRAFETISPMRFGLALLLTAASYFALTFYDLFALRAIGRRLPYATAAMASFTSYALSHNFGLTALTGASARYRAYGTLGLGIGDIARIVALNGLAFGGGAFLLLGAMMLIAPTLAGVGGHSLGPLATRGLGLALVATVAGVVLLAGRDGRSIRLAHWTFILPGRSIALRFILAACADVTAAGSALFVLVPSGDVTSWPAFLFGYILASFAAILAHVPGGIGVFEAVILVALPQAPQPQLIAALLAYRCIYYLLPLFAAGLIVALQEGRRWRRPVGAALRGAQAVASGLAPTMLAVMVFLGGTVLLISGSLPSVPGRAALMFRLLPMPFVELSHLAASMIGVALLVLAAGLYRRLDGAFWLTRLLLLAGAAFSLLKGFDYEEAAVMLLLAAALQWTRGAFYRRTRLMREALSPGWLLLVAMAIGLSVWIGFFAYKHVAYQDDLWWHFAERGNASRFLRSSLAGAVLLATICIWWLMRPASVRVVAQTHLAPPMCDALGLATRTDANLAFTGDKRFLVSASGRCMVMYQIRGHSWIAMGDPVGDRSEWSDLLWDLRVAADAAQGRLLLYQIGIEALPIAIELGLQIVKYGEEARVDLRSLTLEGPSAKSLRYSQRRAEREGLSFEIVPARNVPFILARLQELSDNWLAQKGQREKGFSVGRFDPLYLARFDCAVVRHGERIIAFANLWTTPDRSELSIDLMRHDENLPYGAMDFLFVRLMRWGQEEGYRWFSLGVAPLSGLEERRLAPLWMRLGAVLYRHGESLYGFEGLRAYKEKFSPVWEPRFIAGPQGFDFARALYDLQALIGGRR